MWGARNGVPEYSQAQIFEAVGGTYGGLYVSQIRDAAARFAGVWDAVEDYAYSEDTEARRQFFARQISSINNGSPAIIIVEGGFHAVVLKGGTWHRETETINVWDDVIVHDPKNWPDRSYSAAHWEDYSLAGYQIYTQIVSENATLNWGSHYDAYGDSIAITGKLQPLQPEW